MIKGLYASEGSMRPKLTQMEVLANNIANINTIGYKRERVFVEQLRESTKGHEDGRGDLEGVGFERYVDMTNGSLRQTDNPLDLALQGEGFFAVETPQGTRYTRNGNFSLSTDGTLQTTEGHAVLGVEGKVRLPNLDRAETRKLRVANDGEIMLGNEHVGRLRIVEITDPQHLKKEAQSLFVTTEGQKVTDLPADQVRVRQGYVEESNVEGIEEMIAMVELGRGFETGQRVIRAQEATLERSMEIGKL